MGLSRQEYWSGLPFPYPEDLPDPGIKPGSPALQADSLPSEPPGKPQLFFSFFRKNREAQGKGLPEITQQPGGRGPCGPSLGAVGLSGREGLSRKSRLPSGPTHSASPGSLSRPLPQNIPPHPSGLPWAPAPHSSTAGDCASRLAGAQVISCNWVSGLLVVMLMGGRWDPWLLGWGGPDCSQGPTALPTQHLP